MKRAYVVNSAASGAEFSVICFAENPTVAKKIGWNSPGFDYEEWIDLRAKREPRCDNLVSLGRDCIDGAQSGDEKIMRDLGWYQVEYSSEECEECERYEWESIPESVLVEDGERLICRGCLAKEREGGG